jgi:NADH-quinone oxidoreductase subunit M
MQKDMKKLIAYSSVAHMGYVTIGLFTFKEEGIDGAIIQMLSHGLVSAALFLCIGVLYDRMHTRMISDYGGVIKNMPKFALVFMIFMLASIGLPGTSGFVGELLVLIAAYEVSGYLAFFVGLGMILGAAYMLWLYKRVIFGVSENKNIKDLIDIDKRESIIFIPIIIGVFWLGIYPESFSIEFKESVINLVNSFNNRVLN